MKTENIRVMMLGVYWRNDQPGGIAITGQFRTDAEGVHACEQLEQRLHTLDQIDVDTCEQRLRLHAQKSVSGDEVDSVLASDVALHVYWMVRRGHLKQDEYNGVIFGCEVDGAIVFSELNPAIADLRQLADGPNAADITDIMHASKNRYDAGTIAALRAVQDHARRGGQ